MTPMGTIKSYACSTQLHCDGWTLHYVWIYHATSFEDALIQAVQHFNRTQRGMLLSINMTDGERIFVSRVGLDGSMQTHTIPLTDMTTPMIGPDTRRHDYLNN